LFERVSSSARDLEAFTRYGGSPSAHRDLQQRVTTDLRKALKASNRTGKRMILDLRNNPGGLLDEAVSQPVNFWHW